MAQLLYIFAKMKRNVISSAFLLLLILAITNAKGGSRSSSKSSSKSGNKSKGSSDSGSSYPRQQWEPAKSGQPTHGTANNPSPNYGQPGNNYGQPSAPNYGQPHQGQPAPNYGQPHQGYPAPNYGQPHQGQPAPNYGQPHQGYPAPNYGSPHQGQPAPNYGQPHQGYPAPNYGHPSNNYGQHGNNFGQQGINNFGKAPNSHSTGKTIATHVAAGLAGAYIAHKVHNVMDDMNRPRMHYGYDRDYESRNYGGGTYVSENQNVPNSHGTGAAARGPTSRRDKTPIMFLGVEPRRDWGARPPRRHNFRIEKHFSHVIVHHTDTEDCYNRTACVSQLLRIQNQHMDVKDLADIGYNFLIGGDGRAFEGLGWTRISEITKTTLDPYSLQVAFLGNFTLYPPTFAQLETFDVLLQYADKKDYLKSFRIHGHRDVSCTTCPGEALYQLLKQINRYVSFGDPAQLCPGGGANGANGTTVNFLNPIIPDGNSASLNLARLPDPPRLPDPKIPSIYPSLNVSEEAKLPHLYVPEEPKVPEMPAKLPIDNVPGDTPSSKPANGNATHISAALDDASLTDLADLLDKASLDFEKDKDNTPKVSA